LKKYCEPQMSHCERAPCQRSVGAS
jgi:hypothetical protein